MNWLKANAGSLLLFIAVMIMMLYGFQDASEQSRAEGLRMTEKCLRRAVVSCYALEGRYPPNVAYLEQQYGLQIDGKKYIVHYEIFAENIMPELTVMER